MSGEEHLVTETARKVFNLMRENVIEADAYTGPDQDWVYNFEYDALKAQTESFDWMMETGGPSWLPRRLACALPFEVDFDRYDVNIYSNTNPEMQSIISELVFSLGGNLIAWPPGGACVEYYCKMGGRLIRAEYFVSGAGIDEIKYLRITIGKKELT